jgi:hypothetical protein
MNYVCLCVCVCVCPHTSINVPRLAYLVGQFLVAAALHVYIHICIHVCVCVYVCVFVCLCVCVYKYMNPCEY